MIAVHSDEVVGKLDVGAVVGHDARNLSMPARREWDTRDRGRHHPRLVLAHLLFRRDPVELGLHDGSLLDEYVLLLHGSSVRLAQYAPAPRTQRLTLE